MSRNNYGQLNHHEELRYNYLLKNIHYLNEREKMEFQYLHHKKQQYGHREGQKVHPLILIMRNLILILIIKMTIFTQSLS